MQKEAKYESVKILLGSLQHIDNDLSWSEIDEQEEKRGIHVSTGYVDGGCDTAHRKGEREPIES